MTGAGGDDVAAPTSRVEIFWRVAGLVVAVAAVALCTRTLVSSWPQVRSAFAHARLGWLVLALLCGFAAMCGLALVWWRCLLRVDAAARPIDAVGTYFAGELGKYVPGGIWAAVGRGELARRIGAADRSAAYASVLLAYAAMTVGAAATFGVLGPLAAALGRAPGWAWCALPAVLAAAAVAHPRMLDPVLSLARRASGGRVTLRAPSWSTTAGLAASSVPAWLALGAASACVAQGLGVSESPLRVAAAAIAAWIVGFLAVPVPAGVGVREVVFVVLCGLPATAATTVAVTTRVLMVVVDAGAGIAGLAVVARAVPRRQNAGTG